ncbi:MAG TPA: hypothetical protein VNH42_02850 [Mariprofundaceae bacterium]|nr:hypothetical protein [Mariprofundaceae bacterium]
MKTGYCETCGKQTNWKREIGLPFWVGVLLTGGLWLITIPIAPLRCTGCGAEQLRQSAHFRRKTYTPKNPESL